MTDSLSRPKVVLTDLGSLFPEPIRALFTQAGIDIVDAEQHPDADPVSLMRDADALLVVWYPVTEAVIGQLTRCKVIVRAGIGYDNIDAAAAKARGIPVCNVPDYCIHEVADQAMAMVLSLARQLPALDKSVREGDWPKLPPLPLPALNSLTFGTLGLGRIGKAVQQRAQAFHFRRIACDPYLPDSAFEAAGVERVTLDTLVSESDILSLHTPLTAETRHILDAARLAQMKPGAILVNTSRGPVVDTLALAEALQSGRLAAAGLDVTEVEPLEPDHPLRRCPNVLLAPHTAWHSIQSAQNLLRMSAEEVIRGVRGEPLRSRMNP